MARAGRTFLPLDVNYFDDPKVVELSDGSVLLDVKAMLLMKRTHSDGQITRRQLEREASIGGDIGAMIAELIGCGLYVDAGSHLQRGGWHGWNDPASDVEAMAKGGKYGNHVKWHVNKGKVNPSCPFCSGSESPPESPPNPTRIAEQRRGEENRGELKTAQPQAVGAVGDSASITPIEAPGPYEADFDILWDSYPRKKERKAALRAYVATRRRGADPAELLKAVVNYALATARSAPQHVKHGARFFGPDEPWIDYVQGIPQSDSPLPPVGASRNAGGGARSRLDLAHGDIAAYRAAGEHGLAEEIQSQVDAGAFDD